MVHNQNPKNILCPRGLNILEDGWIIIPVSHIRIVQQQLGLVQVVEPERILLCSSWKQ